MSLVHTRAFIVTPPKCCTYRCLLKPQTQAHILAAVLARVVRAHVDTALNAQVAAGLVLVHAPPGAVLPQ